MIIIFYALQYTFNIIYEEFSAVLFRQWENNRSSRSTRINQILTLHQVINISRGALVNDTLNLLSDIIITSNDVQILERISRKTLEFECVFRISLSIHQNIELGLLLALLVIIADIIKSSKDVMHSPGHH